MRFPTRKTLLDLTITLNIFSCELWVLIYLPAFPVCSYTIEISIIELNTYVRVPESIKWLANSLPGILFSHKSFPCIKFEVFSSQYGSVLYIASLDQFIYLAENLRK